MTACRQLNKYLGRLRKWIATTIKTLRKLWESEVSPELGIFLSSVFLIYDHTREDPPWKDLVYYYRRLTEQELKDSAAQPARFGCTFSTFVTVGSLLIPKLMNKVRDLGGSFVKRHIKSFSELSCYDVIVNCTGLGARELIPSDTELRPVRGQVIQIKAPWIKHVSFYFSEEEKKDERITYIIPQIDSIIVGGTHQFDNVNAEPTLEDTERIISGASRIIPSIKDATILKNWAGLRPARSSIRLEKERVKCPDKQETIIDVVHNYGHGGAGLAMSFGCADECSNLVLTMLADKKKAKL